MDFVQQWYLKKRKIYSVYKQDKVYMANKIRVRVIKLSGKRGNIFKCSKLINKATNLREMIKVCMQTYKE